jgi:chromosomal replication initiation ATPase DnaA
MSQIDQLPLALAHRAASDRENFLPAPCNRDALAWLDRWPAWPACALVLYGPSGCGKTHLASIWAERAHASWLDRAPPIGARPAAVRAFVLDDVDQGAGGPADEVALLQFYNWVAEQRGHMLLTARRPVAGWDLDLPDLASRLRAAPAIAIGAPDDALLGALLIKLFGDRQLGVSEEVIRYMLAHMERSFAAARALVAAMDARSLAQRRAITIPLVRTTLEQLDESGPGANPAPTTLGGT